MDRRYDNYNRQGFDEEEGEWSLFSKKSNQYTTAPPIRGEIDPSRDNAHDSRHWNDHQSYQNDKYDDHQEEDEGQRRSFPATQLRLVKLTSDVLAEEQKVAIIDGRSEGVSIGRDRSFTARIRCPSMEVSKHHANIFRMANDNLGGRNKSKGKEILFAIADTGSTHGTYILLNSPPIVSIDALPPITAYERLSPAKKASIPKCLRHMSLLRVGKTVFQAHLHPDSHQGWSTSCDECVLSEDGKNEILLTVKEKKESVASSVQVSKVVPYQATVKIAPKQAIQDLKNRHLGEEESSEATPSDYVDRAAARRARGGVAAATSTIKTSAAADSLKDAHQIVAAPTSSVPAAKLDASNRGYQMFSSMSGKSADTTISHDPILARGVEGKAGLGSKRLLDVQEIGSRPSGYSPESVRERQRRRFQESK